MEKNIFLKITLLMGLLLASIFSYANPIVTRNAVEVTPLPTLEINELNLDGYKATIANAKEEAVLPVHPALGAQFDLPQMEEQVLDYLNSNHIMNAPAPPMVPPGSFGGWMAEIGQGNYSAKAKKAKEVVDKAIEIGRYIDILTGGNLESMPIIKTQTIGTNDISLIFNSAKIYPEFAEIEVYVKIEMNGRKDFHGDPVELYFGAQNIYFSQEKGLISGSVGLLADYSVKLGESSDAGLWLTKMNAELLDDKGTPTPLDDEYNYTGTYINFDCEGFKEMGLGGHVIMSRDWVIPTDEFGVPLTTPNGSPGNTPRVNAGFQVIAQDFNDVMVSVDIEDPFVLTSWQDMSFSLTNATLDMSSYRNPTDIPYDVPDMIWEGVYIENISITLPEPFKRSCSSFADAQQTGGGNSNPPPPGSTEQQNPNYEAPQTCRMKVSANHLLLDGDGVTGQFELEGQAPLIGGAVMDGEWGWSLNTIGIFVAQSEITGFSFAGEIGAPIISKNTPLEYDASFNFGASMYDFNVAVPADKPIKIPVWNAAQVIIESPTVNITIDQGEFSAGVIFQTTTIQIGNPADYTTSNTGSMVKMPGLTVHELALNTRAPYFTVGGVDINTGDSKVSNFPVTINGLSMDTNPNDPEELLLGFTIGLNLMDSGSTGVQASGDLTIKGEYVRDIDGTRSWKYKDLQFDGANIVACFPQFYGSGFLIVNGCNFWKY